MSSTESDSSFVAEDEDEENKIYQLIYDMNTKDDDEDKEGVEIPSSSGHTPVHFKISPEKKTPAGVGKTTRLDMDALDHIPENLVLKVDVKEKPWRKAGADITDYFNYGFDEESWKSYCKKQTKLHAANRKRYTKIMVQKGHTRHEEDSTYSPSGSPSILASRPPSAAIDVIGEQPGFSGVEEHLSDDGNYMQMVTELFLEEEVINPYHRPPPSNITSLSVFNPSPQYLYPSGPPSLSQAVTLNSGHTRGFDDPSTSRYPHVSGAPPLMPKNNICRAGVIDAAKAWECYVRQETCESGFVRSRLRGHDEDSNRGRVIYRESSSSSHSREEQLRHRDTTERGHKRHRFERFSEENKERHRERRHRDKSKACSSRSSRSSRDGGEDRDSQSRHKEAKRHRKEKETSKIFSADRERKLKSDSQSV